MSDAAAVRPAAVADHAPAAAPSTAPDHADAASHAIAVAAIAAALALHRAHPAPVAPRTSPAPSAWTALARAEALRR